MFSIEVNSVETNKFNRSVGVRIDEDIQGVSYVLVGKIFIQILADYILRFLLLLQYCFMMYLRYIEYYITTFRSFQI